MTCRKGAAPAVGEGSRKDKTEAGDLLREKVEGGAGPGRAGGMWLGGGQRAWSWDQQLVSRLFLLTALASQRRGSPNARELGDPLEGIPPPPQIKLPWRGIVAKCSSGTIGCPRWGAIESLV